MTAVLTEVGCARFRETLAESLVVIGLDAPKELLERCCAFAEILLDANIRMNLTRITDPRDMAVKHFADSLSVLKAGLGQPAKLVDIGSGGGFPGIPLALARPDLRVWLIEATQKKADFLRQAVEQLDLPNSSVVEGRAEQLAHEPELRECFDASVWRGLGDLAVGTEVCLPFVRPGGLAIAMKGPRLDEELTQAGAMIVTAGADVETIVEVDLPGGIHHRLLVLRKTRPTPAHLPRPWGRIRKGR